jgi:long-chain acyl-CoA synthetase
VHQLDLPEKKRSDICMILYTSGTIGELKGVMITNESLLINITGADSVVQSVGEVVSKESQVYYYVRIMVTYCTWLILVVVRSLIAV